MVGDGGISWSISSAFCCVLIVKTDPSKKKKTNKIKKNKKKNVLKESMFSILLCDSQCANHLKRVYAEAIPIMIVHRLSFFLFVLYLTRIIKYTQDSIQNVEIPSILNFGLKVFH